MGAFLDLRRRHPRGDQVQEQGSACSPQLLTSRLFEVANIETSYADILLSFLIHIVIHQKRASSIALDSELEMMVSQLFNELDNLLVKAKKEGSSEQRLMIIRLRDVMYSSVDDMVKNRADAFILGSRQLVR